MNEQFPVLANRLEQLKIQSGGASTRMCVLGSTYQELAPTVNIRRGLSHARSEFARRIEYRPRNRNGEATPLKTDFEIKVGIVGVCLNRNGDFRLFV
jgi:hypothetical protein